MTVLVLSLKFPSLELLKKFCLRLNVRNSNEGEEEGKVWPYFWSTYLFRELGRSQPPTCAKSSLFFLTGRREKTF